MKQSFVTHCLHRRWKERQRWLARIASHARRQARWHRTQAPRPPPGFSAWCLLTTDISGALSEVWKEVLTVCSVSAKLGLL
jgi:hypothetical protein